MIRAWFSGWCVPAQAQLLHAPSRGRVGSLVAQAEGAGWREARPVVQRAVPDWQVPAYRRRLQATSGQTPHACHPVQA